MPSISVVIPTHNRPELLREALASVAAQRGVRPEVIVVNDAGCDVAPVIRAFDQVLDINYVSLRRSGGAATARNAGLARARGEFIAYLDDDDLYRPGHLERLASALRVGTAAFIYSDALVIRQRQTRAGWRATASRMLAHEYDRETMLHDSFIAPSAVMHRRQCVERLGGFDEAMRWYEDWEFFLRFTERYPVARLAGASALVRLRDDGGNASSRWGPERAAAAYTLRVRYGAHHILPKTFWEVASTLTAASRRPAFSR